MYRNDFSMKRQFAASSFYINSLLVGSDKMPGLGPFSEIPFTFSANYFYKKTGIDRDNGLTTNAQAEKALRYLRPRPIHRQFCPKHCQSCRHN